MRSDFGLSDKMTSDGGVSNDIGLSHIDTLVGQCSPSGKIGPSRFPVGFAGVDIPPLEELTAQGKFPQQSRYHRDQPAKTVLKDFFELIAVTLLDPSYTNLSLSSDQTIQSTRAVGLEVNLVSRGLLEDLVLRAGGAGNLGVRG